ncbi:MAG: fatty acid desaturase [Pseudomonadota bacterium]|nr:fatty acid desaturase [Pseudomonadota bacterium]
MSQTDTVSSHPLPQVGIPHRKVVRAWLAVLGGRSTATALLLLAFDVALFSGTIALTVLAQSLALKLLAGVAAGLLTGRLFILGHDACHQSFTPHRGLNRVLGRIAFLPSLTPYSLWDVGHNVVHHGYTNLKGFDFVWAPLTLAEYLALPAWRRTLERIYRSGWGAGIYYFIEMWWLRMYFPRSAYLGARRAVFTRDCLLVTAFALAWIGGLGVAAGATGQSALLLIATGFVLPFVVWNYMIGFVVYVHHTHTAVSWHDDKAVWAKAQPFVSTTVHLTFPCGIGAALHHIMEHTAHHVDMGVPLYRLEAAQQLLEDRLPGCIIVQPFSVRWYFETAQRCKLYDFQRHQWTDFDGRATAPPRPQPATLASA